MVGGTGFALLVCAFGARPLCSVSEAFRGSQVGFRALCKLTDVTACCLEQVFRNAGMTQGYFA